MPNHVGDQITVTLSSTCDENLTATDPGLCTLQIVSLDFIDSIHITSEHVCTLTPSIDSVTTSFKQTVSELVCNAQCILTYPSSLIKCDLHADYIYAHTFTYVLPLSDYIQTCIPALQHARKIPCTRQIILL